MTSALQTAATPNDLSNFFMPFTANRSFKQRPRLVSRAAGMYYYTSDGRELLDAAAGLWCSNAGHNHPRIVSAIQAQAADLDYAPSFNVSHPLAFQAASRIAALAPDGLDSVFFTNSGSEAVDTALKIAIAYWRVKGQGAKTRLIGRERGYHGIGMGGISVGGIMANRKQFHSMMIPGVDHLPHTYDREKQAFSRGCPEYGAHFADELERIIQLHDASTIAAVIVEPMAGSTGVLAPPKGYLKRLRDIATRHDILLIFDEVITGFGRTGAPFAALTEGVTPDLFTFAKGVTSGTVPMGGVVCRKDMYETLMQGPEHVVEFCHGYTYSAHPLACAAAIAAMDVYRDEKLFENASRLEGKWQDAIYSLQGLPNVIDIRQYGITAGIELASRPDGVGKRAYAALEAGFHDHGIVVRTTGETIAVTPPLIFTEKHIDELVTKLGKVIRSVA
ncbi:MAG: aspartate aminotransferase family protein [Proteobacteria bacterium]|nr:aspartate aminotransferase family protein [Pseudomonadota bacterium]